MRAERRRIAAAVLLCAAGAALVLLAAGRAWASEVLVRPAPLPDEEIVYRGGDLAAWLSPLGWVALAGAGAVLATRGLARRVLGVVLALSGAGLAAGVVAAAARADVGLLWPVLCAVGAAGVIAAGGWVAVAGHRWPAMGARYDRPGARRAQAADASAGAGTAAGSGAAERAHGDDGSAARMWDALDRGEDPTA